MFLNNTIPHHQLLQNMSSKAQLEAQLMITGPKRTVAIWAVLQPNQHAKKLGQLWFTTWKTSSCSLKNKVLKNTVSCLQSSFTPIIIHQVFLLSVEGAILDPWPGRCSKWNVTQLTSWSPQLCSPLAQHILVSVGCLLSSSHNYPLIFKWCLHTKFKQKYHFFADYVLMSRIVCQP